MEKLIELLNEHHHFNSDLIYYWWDEECERVYFHTELPEEEKKKLWDALIDDGIDEQRINDERIISKKFWFIKRLIENKKIDLQELVKKQMASGWDFEWEKVEREDESEEFFVEFYTEITLMLLSIHDNPIQLLLDILR